MAAIGVALWKYVMRYAPHSPDWFNRDRFVLSNGELAERDGRDLSPFVGPTGSNVKICSSLT